MLKKVRIQDAVGKVLCHDLTRIVRDKFKGPAFKKGHVIRERDLAELLNIGKRHIYVLDLKSGDLHENDAARRVGKVAAGKNIVLSAVSEGRINLMSAIDGLLKVDVQKLEKLNSIEGIIFASLHNNKAVGRNQVLAGTRVVPLVIEAALIENAEQLCQDTEILNVQPFPQKKIDLIVTGSEVFSGRIQDEFGPVVTKKIEQYNCIVRRKTIVDDHQKEIVAAINESIDQDADMVILTGGMSVDPDDNTPDSIKALGAEIVTYGAPVLPGAMIMLAYIGERPVIGLPGCVMYHRATVFDLIFPRLVIGEKLQKADFAKMGHGGLCLGCDQCRYPNCEFGKGYR